MKFVTSPFLALILTFGFFVQIANHQATIDSIERKSQLLDEEINNSMRHIMQRLHDRHQLRGQLINEYKVYCY